MDILALQARIAREVATPSGHVFLPTQAEVARAEATRCAGLLAQARRMFVQAVKLLGTNSRRPAVFNSTARKEASRLRRSKAMAALNRARGALIRAEAANAAAATAWAAFNAEVVPVASLNS